MNSVFANSYIKTESDAVNNNIISVSFVSEDFIECEEEIFIKGMPLALAKNSLDKYALMVVVVSGTSQSNISFSLYGANFSMRAINDEYYSIHCRSEEFTDIGSEVIIGGTPLSLGDNKQLIVKKKENYTIRDSGLVMLGGCLFLFIK